jgi:hypothetical protein
MSVDAELQHYLVDKVILFFSVRSCWWRKIMDQFPHKKNSLLQPADFLQT